MSDAIEEVVREMLQHANSNGGALGEPAYAHTLRNWADRLAAPAKAREDGIAKIIDSMEHDAADIRLGRQWMSACEHYLPKLRALATFAEGA